MKTNLQQIEFIEDDKNIKLTVYSYKNNNICYEYFIGIDSDLDKIELVEVYDFNIKKFKEYVLREKDNFIENLFKNLNEETGLRNIICEEDEEKENDGRRNSVKQKSRRRKSVKQKSRRRKSRRRKSS